MMWLTSAEMHQQIIAHVEKGLAECGAESMNGFCFNRYFFNERQW